MTLPSLTIPDDAYQLAWENRKPDETVPEVIAWCIHFAFDVELRPVNRKPISTRITPPVRPLLEWVTVVDPEASHG